MRPLLRLDRFETAEHFETLEKTTARRRQLGLAELQAGLHAVCDPEMTMQTMVFEPRELRLHLAIGAVPASAHALRVLDLGSLFQKP